MRKTLMTAGAALLLGAGGAAAQTISLVEVITSPPRTEQLRAMVAEFEAANPGVTVEITSLPWGQAFERLATMVQGGNIPDVVEMPDRWLALYANSGALVDPPPTWSSGRARRNSPTRPRNSAASSPARPT